MPMGPKGAAHERLATPLLISLVVARLARAAGVIRWVRDRDRGLVDLVRREMRFDFLNDLVHGFALELPVIEHQFLLTVRLVNDGDALVPSLLVESRDLVEWNGVPPTRREAVFVRRDPPAV